MNTVVEIGIVLFVMFAALQDDWASALAAVAGALVLGVLASMSGENDRRDRWGA
jgi:hypothetical protein